MQLAANISLTEYNTFRIPARAGLFAEVTSEATLAEVFNLPGAKKHPLLVLGGGSNILFTKDFDGLVVKIAIGGINATETNDGIFVTAGAGVVWNELVKYCVLHNYPGLENLSLIPGTVGASPVQNIGAYGVELKDVFFSCRAFNISSGKIEIFSNADCRFGYRDSVFKNVLKGKYIITEVTFLLKKDAPLNTGYGAIGEELKRRGIEHPNIKDISEAVSSIRVSKLPDPSTIGNAGSFFKNPVIEVQDFEALFKNYPGVVHYPAGAGRVKLAAGWLIEQCGFRGMVSGHTGTWKNQALVLVNHGGATGREVYDFSERIITEVYNKFQIRLEREVNIL